MKCMEEYDENLKACPKCGTLSAAKRTEKYHLPTGTMLEKRYIAGMVVSESSIQIKYIGYDTEENKKVYIYEYFPINLVVRDESNNFVTFPTSLKEKYFAKGLNAYVEETIKLRQISGLKYFERIKDFFIENNTCYTVCEYEKYVTLKNYIKKNKDIGICRASAIFNSLASALEVLHENGIIHGNISPEHIAVIREKGTTNAIFIDFGYGSYINSTGLPIYNPNYSPEEAKRENAVVYKSSDVYSMAVLLYRLLTGITPYSVYEQLNGKPIIGIRRLGINISKSYENAIFNAMNIVPNKRYYNIKAFCSALKSNKTKRITDNINKNIYKKGIFVKAFVLSLVLFVLAGVGTGMFVVFKYNESKKIFSIDKSTAIDGYYPLRDKLAEYIDGEFNTNDIDDKGRIIIKFKIGQNNFEHTPNTNSIIINGEKKDFEISSKYIEDSVYIPYEMLEKILEVSEVPFEIKNDTEHWELQNTEESKQEDVVNKDTQDIIDDTDRDNDASVSSSSI